MIDNVNIAINAILTGGVVQSYSINGRQLSRYSLKDLRELKDSLTAELSAGKGGRNFVEFVSP